MPEPGDRPAAGRQVAGLASRSPRLPDRPASREPPPISRDPESMSSEPAPALESIPAPDPRKVAIHIDRSGERQLRKRHPWLFEQGVRSQSHEGRTGDIAVVFDHNRNFLAVGLYDPHSTLRVRVLHAGKPIRVDEAFFTRRIAELAEARSGFDPLRTDGFRLVHGENEGMPGFILDRYADTLVLKLYTPAWIPHLRSVLPGLRSLPGVERLVLRLGRKVQARPDELFGLEDGQVLFGSSSPEPVVFLENGMRFECDPVRGQKTGFFLDQRENRARVEQLSRDREVLNVFSYSGGFSLFAARGGARHVVSLDKSRPALDAAERNFALNADDPTISAAQHEVLGADAFQGMKELAEAGRRFGLLIIDPPSFAHRQDDVPRALVSYRRLAELIPALLRPNGLLVFASCSARIGADDFFRTVLRALQGSGREVQEFDRTAHASDHPVGFAQGAYLKCLYAKAP